MNVQGPGIRGQWAVNSAAGCARCGVVGKLHTLDAMNKTISGSYALAADLWSLAPVPEAHV